MVWRYCVVCVDSEWISAPDQVCCQSLVRGSEGVASSGGRRTAPIWQYQSGLRTVGLLVQLHSMTFTTYGLVDEENPSFMMA